MIGKIFTFPFFEIDPKVNIFTLFTSLLQLAVTLLIGVYVAGKIQKNKSEKELIIKRIDVIASLVEQFHLDVSDGKIQYSEAAAYMKRISLNLGKIQEAMRVLSMPPHTQEFQEITETIRQIRDYTTNTPSNAQQAITNSNLDIQVKEGLVELAKQRVNLINIEYDNLKGKLLILQLKINQS